MKPESVNEGNLISIELVSGTTLHSCYIGIVTTADQAGIMMNPAEWDELNGITLGKDGLHVPWENVKSMLICTGYSYSNN